MVVNATTPILNLPQAISLNGTEWMILVQGGTTKRAQTGTVVDAAITANFPAAIEFVTGAKGGTISTGQAGWLTVPFACTINSATLLADQTGSIVMDIWKTSYAGYPTVSSAQSITGNNPPTITAGVQYQDPGLAGWTKALSAGDILVFNVNSNATIQEVTLSLSVARSLL